MSPRSDDRQVREMSVMDKGALEQVFLPVLPYSPINIIPPMFCTHFDLEVRHPRRVFKL